MNKSAEAKKWDKILESEGLATICLATERKNGKEHGGRRVSVEKLGFEQKTIGSAYESLNADSMWDALALSLTATPKEADIADRARGSICGLDNCGRLKRLRLKRNHREPGKEWRKRIHDHIINAPVCAYS